MRVRIGGPKAVPRRRNPFEGLILVALVVMIALVAVTLTERSSATPAADPGEFVLMDTIANGLAPPAEAALPPAAFGSNTTVMSSVDTGGTAIPAHLAGITVNATNPSSRDGVGLLSNLGSADQYVRETERAGGQTVQYIVDDGSNAPSEGFSVGVEGHAFMSGIIDRYDPASVYSIAVLLTLGVLAIVFGRDRFLLQGRISKGFGGPIFAVLFFPGRKTGISKRFGAPICSATA